MEKLNRRFGAFFLTQFMGAFNDNVYKNALTILVAFKATSEAQAGWLTALAGGLFILPFLLFSAISGQLADQIPKSKIIVWSKVAEVLIMFAAVLGFFIDSVPLLMGVLFLMGTHSTFFGPTKYSVIPELVPKEQLMNATAWIEMGTFLAILSGTIVGGILVGWGDWGISIGVTGIAALGLWTALKIGATPAVGAGKRLTLELNPFRQYAQMYRVANQETSVYLAIIAISWFWYCGSTFLAQMSTYVKFMLRGDESVVTLFLATFTLSLAFGSLVCNRLSAGKIEVGLVPFGALGMGLFTFDLALIDYKVVGSQLIHFSDILSFYASALHWRVMWDLFMIGFFGSLYIVPLYAVLQQRSSRDTCSQVIAANNVVNAVFMVASAVAAMMLYALGFDTARLFFAVGVMHLLLSFYLFAALPEFVLRAVFWCLQKTHFKAANGESSLPPRGSVLLHCDQNGQGMIETLLLVTYACQRSVSFVLAERYFAHPVLGWLLRLWRFIPLQVENSGEMTAVTQEAIAQRLRQGQAVAIVTARTDKAIGESLPRLAALPETTASLFRFQVEKQRLPEKWRTRLRFKFY